MIKSQQPPLTCAPAADTIMFAVTFLTDLNSLINFVFKLGIASKTDVDVALAC